MKNVLITGGAGFIGSNLALELIRKNYKVTILDNLSRQIHGEAPLETSPLYRSVADKVTFIKGDVTNRSDWEKAIADNHIIVHLAAETGTGQSMYEIQKYVTVNITGTAIMLDYLTNNKHNVEKIIIASSRAIYGEGKYFAENTGYVYPESRSPQNLCNGIFEVTYPGIEEPLKLVATDENARIHPTSVYGITKQNQEQMVMSVCKAIGIHPVAFRYQNVYGPGQSLSNPYTGILSIFSTLIKNGKTINIFEDGEESRDFVYINDVVVATILGIEKEEANGNIFNVGTGTPTSVRTVAETLIRCYNTNTPIEINGNYRIGDIRHNYADLTKIKTLLGFNPAYTFEQGIQNFTKWVNQQEIKVSKYDQSIQEMKSKGLYK